MNIYQIDDAMQAMIDMDVDELIDPETGEILLLETLQMEREQKLENAACAYKNLDAEEAALRNEEKKLAKRRHEVATKKAGVKQYLLANLHGEKLKTPRVAISFSKSHAVELANPDLFVAWADENMNSLLTYKQAEPNKNAITQYLKAGGTLPGATLAERMYVIIK